MEKELSEKKKKDIQDQVDIKEKKEETLVVKQYKEDVEKYETLKKNKNKNNKEDKVSANVEISSKCGNTL